MTRPRDRHPALLGAAMLIALGCEHAPPRCIDSTHAPLTAEDRYLLGDAVPLAREPEIELREDELASSMAARRALGWRVAAELVSPVEVGTAAGEIRTVPRFATWYDKEDLRRAYRAIPTGAELTDAALDEAFAYNARAVLDFETWPADRLAAYVESLDSDARAAGLGGVSRVLYDPIAARHLLRSGNELLGCEPGTHDPLEAGASEDRSAQYPLSSCRPLALGPYFVADGGSLDVTTDGEVDVTIDGAEATCDELGCTVAGPARVTLRATPLDMADASLTVRWDDASSLFVPCLAGEMPRGAALLKADYRRADFDMQVDVHDTSADAIGANLDADADWADAVIATSDPGADAIHTVLTAGGATYRLVALHAMVKELDHWVWLTLSWDPNPDAGLGADRPSTIDGAFANYAMCVVTDFVERDPDPAAAFADPTLASLLRTTADHGPETWCSNPYLEEGTHNAASNCMGCHQHAGSGLTSEEILGDDARFPSHGRALVRTNFPTDYVFTTHEVTDILLEP